MKDTYILNHIERYGNCYISNSLYKKLGKSKILGWLRNKGYECEIVEEKSFTYNFEGNTKYPVIDIIIRRVKDE